MIYRKGCGWGWISRIFKYNNRVEEVVIVATTVTRAQRSIKGRVAIVEYFQTSDCRPYDHHMAIKCDGIQAVGAHRLQKWRVCAVRRRTICPGRNPESAVDGRKARARCYLDKSTLRGREEVEVGMLSLSLSLSLCLSLYLAVCLSVVQDVTGSQSVCQVEGGWDWGVGVGRRVA